MRSFAASLYGRVRASFSIANPPRFLRSIGLLSAAVWLILAVASAVNFGTGLRELSIGIDIWLVFGVFPLLWIAYPIVVTGVVAVGRPRSTPLAERNLLLSTFAWIIRTFWGSLLLVIGGFAGGLIASMLDSIASSSTQDLHGTHYVSALVVAFAGGVQFAVFIAMIVFYVASTWMTVSLLWTRRDRRLEALEKVFKISAPEARAMAPYRAVWADHFSGWGYPVVGWLVLVAFVGSVASSVLGEGIDTARDSIVSFVGFIGDYAGAHPEITPTPITTPRP